MATTTEALPGEGREGMSELYESNPDFRGYVDRYCRCYRISVEEALTHELVRLYAEQIFEE